MRVLVVVVTTLGLCLAAAPLALTRAPQLSWASPLASGIAFGVAVPAAVVGIVLLVRAHRREAADRPAGPPPRLAGPPPISQPFPVPARPVPAYPGGAQSPWTGARSPIGERHAQTQAGRALPDDGYVTVRTRW